MKKIAILMCLLVPFTGNAQDDQDPPAKIEWIFNTYFGWATLESEDNYKIQTNAYGIQLGGAVGLSRNLSLVVGIEHVKLYGDHYINDNQVFDTYNYFKIPVLINYEPNFSRNTKMYINAGPYFSNMYRLNREIEASNSDTKSSSLGSNFGFTLGFGIQHEVARNINFKIGLITQGDLAADYKSEFNDIKIKEMLGFNFGIGFNF